MGRVIFVACTNVGQAMIEAICSEEAIQSEIVGIVNLNVRQSMGKANYRSYADVAMKYQIPLHYCDNVNDPETYEWIAARQPDLIIQSGWSQKFAAPLLQLPRYGCIGEHPAPLPRGRGAACVNWAILTGEKEWGDTFFQMVDAYDRGEVYAQKFFSIQEYDNVKTVYDKVALCAKTTILENIDAWSEGRFATIQLDESKATYYKRRRPSDGIFDFSRSAKELHDFIRAQTDPYPGAFFLHDGEKITVLSSCRTNTSSEAPAGTIVRMTEHGGILVVCGDGEILELLRYRREDGIELWFAEDDRFLTIKHF